MDGLNLFLPITKVDVAQRLVYGVAASQTPDKSKEVFDYDSSKPLFERWSGDIAKATDGKSLGNVREMHQPKAAGKVTDLSFDDSNRLITVCTKCVDDDTWRKIEEGVLTGFSIGGKYEKRWSDPNDPMVKRYTANPTEISYVDNPCNPDATFECVKADGTVEMRKFAAKPAEGEGDGAIAEALAKAAADKAAADAEAAAAAAAAQPAETIAQVWLVQKDGSTHPKKEAAASHLAKLVADEAAGAAAAPALAAAAAIEAALGKADGGDKPKGDYGDVKYADPGYQSDGKPRYPVDTEEHIRAAWNYISKEKNAAKYPDGKAAQVKAHIVAAWKDKIDPEGPPSAQDDAAKKAAATADLAKSLYDAAAVCDLIGNIRCIAGNLKWEAMIEGDNSSTPAKAYAACEALCALLTAIVEEETQEIADGTTAEDKEEMALAVSLDAGDIAKALEPMGLAKAAPIIEVLAKAGAKHSAHDQALLDMAHAACTKAAGLDSTPKGAKEHFEEAAKCIKAAGATEEATQSGNDHAKEPVPQGKPGPGGNPRANATQDTRDAGHHAAPQGKPGPARKPGNATVNTEKAALIGDLVDALAKRGPGAHHALASVAHHAIAKACEGGCCKDDDGAMTEVAKRGSRHSAETLATLKLAHDHVVKAMGCENCSKIDDPDHNPIADTKPAKDENDASANSAAKAAETEGLAKLAGLQTENDALKKAFDQVTAKLGEISERLKVVEAEPIPAKTAGPGAAALPPGVRAVEKGAEGTPLGGGEPQADLLKAIEAFASMSPEQQSLVLIKAAHRNPVKVAGFPA